MSALTFPKHDPATTVRRAFLGEALFHMVTIPLLSHPKEYMGLFILRPEEITLTTIFFIRIFAGLIIFGMTPALLHGLPLTDWAIHSRRATYTMLAGTEVFLIPLLIAELLKEGDVKNGAVLSPQVTLGLMTLLVVPFSFRIYALYVKPEMMGRVTVEAKRK